MLKKYIAIEGCIGAGKTEFATKLAKRWNAILLLEEFRDNLYLEKFYEDPERYAFSLEISFMVERFQQLNLALLNKNIFQKSFISDFIFEKSIVFSNFNLRSDQKQILMSLYKIFQKQLIYPDITIYLYRDIKQLKENIIKRGRKFELQISEEYLAGIQDSYISYLKQQSTKQQIIFIDLCKTDFLENETLIDKIASIIEKDMNIS